MRQVLLLLSAILITTGCAAHHTAPANVARDSDGKIIGCVTTRTAKPATNEPLLIGRHLEKLCLYDVAVPLKRLRMVAPINDDDGVSYALAYDTKSHMYICRENVTCCLLPEGPLTPPPEDMFRAPIETKP